MGRDSTLSKCLTLEEVNQASKKRRRQVTSQTNRLIASIILQLNCFLHCGSIWTSSGEPAAKAKALNPLRTDEPIKSSSRNEYNFIECPSIA
jgi:hypothetical protein